MIADLRSPLATHIQAFIAHKRALGKGLHKQELVFRRLDRYLVEHGVASPYGITPAILDGFLCSPSATFAPQLQRTSRLVATIV